MKTIKVGLSLMDINHVIKQNEIKNKMLNWADFYNRNDAP